MWGMIPESDRRVQVCEILRFTLKCWLYMIDDRVYRNLGYIFMGYFKGWIIGYIEIASFTHMAKHFFRRC